jgi:2-C-methyl-D-erythritol 2,4-cyclodiphosphate synthase
MRIGFGYDIHALVPGRPLVLGGIVLPFEKGLFGHSDADALCHAVSDALLGAAALGDIGEHFPDTDPKYKDCSSLYLLCQVVEMVRKAGYVIVNLDTVIVAEAPKLSAYKKTMADAIAQALRLNPDAVSVKAKTHEKFDSTGQGKAIAVYAVALLDEKGQ